MTILHSEYETAEGDLVLFRCKECGYTTQSIGFLHAHVERHWPLWRSFGKLIPGVVRGEHWAQYTEVLAVRETEAIDLAEVEGL
jgi:hypothetical protein